MYYITVSNPFRLCATSNGPSFCEVDFHKTQLLYVWANKVSIRFSAFCLDFGMCRYWWMWPFLSMSQPRRILSKWRRFLHLPMCGWLHKDYRLEQLRWYRRMQCFTRISVPWILQNLCERTWILPLRVWLGLHTESGYFWLHWKEQLWFFLRRFLLDNRWFSDMWLVWFNKKQS